MELEIALKAWAEDTNKALSGVQSSVDKLGARGKPIFRAVAASGVVDAAADPLLIIINDNPAVGRIWNVLGVGVFSGSIGSTPAGSIDMFAGPVGITPVVGEFDYQNIIARNVTANAPGNMVLTRLSVFCHSNEYVYAWVRNGTAAVEYTLVARIAEYRLEDIEAMSL